MSRPHQSRPPVTGDTSVALPRLDPPGLAGALEDAVRAVEAAGLSRTAALKALAGAFAAEVFYDSDSVSVVAVRRRGEPSRIVLFEPARA